MTMTSFASRARSLTPLLASLGVLLLTSACASSGPSKGSANPFRDDLVARGEVEIRIRNFNFADATVWAIAQEGRRERLGIVTGKTDAVFTLPWTFSEAMRMEFDLLAGVRCVTESMTVDPGDIVELQISVDPDSDPQCRRR